MRNTLMVTGGIALGLLAALVAGRAPSLPEVQAQTAAGDNSGTPAVFMGTGGSAPNMNDLCWVMVREKARDKDLKEYDRYNLALYRSMNNGQLFDLIDVREITYDLKATQLDKKGHTGPTPRQMKEAWEKFKKEQEDGRTGREPGH